MLRIDLSGPQGNAYCVMGMVEDVLEQLPNCPKWEREKYIEDAMSSDYDNLIDVSCAILDKYNIDNDINYQTMDYDEEEEEDDDE